MLRLFSIVQLHVVCGFKCLAFTLLVMRYSQVRSSALAEITMVFDGNEKPKAVKCYCTRTFLRFVNVLLHSTKFMLTRATVAFDFISSRLSQ